ncbi:MAG: hypothetical protein H6696_19500 [Deferribacteres bacterium]|nr:hypothetical protein [candidate division KSB1 bacterium]MCB9504114.1 hypothetical protein [Deferribacteres bacterium]
MKNGISYKSSFRSAAQQNLKLSIGFLIIFPFLLQFLDPGTSYFDHLALLVFVAFLCFIFPVIKYSFIRIYKVVLTQDQIKFYYKNGKNKTYLWNEIDLVWQSGFKWYFKPLSDRKIILPEIGFDDESWYDFSEKVDQYRQISSEISPENTETNRSVFSGEVIFKAQYNNKYIVAIIGCTMAVIFGWIFLLTTSKDFVHSEIEVLIAISGMTVMVLYTPFILFKKIYLRNNIIIERFVLPKKIIEYSDITDISGLSIFTKKGRIPINILNNAHVLIGALEKKLDEGYLTERQINGKGSYKEFAGLKASIFSIPISWLIYFMTPLLGLENLLNYPLITFLSVFLVVHFIIYIVIKTWFKN